MSYHLDYELIGELLKEANFWYRSSIYALGNIVSESGDIINSVTYLLDTYTKCSSTDITPKSIYTFCKSKGYAIYYEKGLR